MSSGERFLVNSFKIHGREWESRAQVNKAGAVYPVFVGFRRIVCVFAATYRGNVKALR